MNRPTDTSKRYLAHRIVYRGTVYPMSVVTLLDTPAGVKVAIEKFEGEIHSTIFHSGTITVVEGSRPRLVFS